MTDIIANNFYLILFLPLWLFLIIMIGRFFAVYVNQRLIYFLTLLSSAAGAIFSGFLLFRFNNNLIFETEYPFIKIKDFIINAGIHIDKLSLIFVFVLFSVSFFVQIFSIGYMKSCKKQYRFYALLNLFNFALAGLFLSPNLFQTYVFWEIAGIVSYLLIGFDYNNSQKSLAARKVFIMNKIGDTALISAIILCSYYLYEYAPAKSLATLSFSELNISSMLVSVYATEPVFTIICILFVIAACVKSAQIPFYTWLQDAMEAKLPVSALLHSATLVTAGVYLIVRLMPFFTTEEIILKIITITGLLTAFVCSLSACAQLHPKKALAYSTSAQLGLMLFAAGTLNIKASLALFSAHAYIKSMLFILLPEENQKWNITNFSLFLIGGLSLSGLIFSGYAAKEMTVYQSGNISAIIFIILSFITAFYIARIAFKIVEARGLELSPHLSETTLISSVGLLTLNILLYIYLKKHCEYEISGLFVSALLGWALVYLLYKKQWFCKVPVLYSLSYNGFYLEKFYMAIVTKLYNYIACFCSFVDDKILSNYKLPVLAAKTGVKTIDWIEKNIMFKAVDLTADLTKYLSKINNIVQNGDIRRYNLYAFTITVLIITGLVISYTAILNYMSGG